jgi:hypothetical protein
MQAATKLGTAVVVATAIMILVNAPLAMGGSTQLCSTDPATSCTVLTHVHASSPSGNNVNILTDILNVECDLLYLGDSHGLGAPLVLEGAFTYSNCNNGCTVTEENGPGLLELLKVSHETANLTLEWLIHVECGFFIDCNYNGEGLKGIAKGSLLSFKEGETFEKLKLREEAGSFFCPDTNNLDFLVLSLSSLYIGS